MNELWESKELWLKVQDKIFDALVVGDIGKAKELARKYIEMCKT